MFSLIFLFRQIMICVYIYHHIMFLYLVCMSIARVSNIWNRLIFSSQHILMGDYEKCNSDVWVYILYTHIHAIKYYRRISNVIIFKRVKKKKKMYFTFFQFNFKIFPNSLISWKIIIVYHFWKLKIINNTSFVFCSMLFYRLNESLTYLQFF